MAAKDWTHIYEAHAGKWVAIDADDEVTVVAAHEDARVAYAESKRLGKRAILHRVPEEVLDLAAYEI